MNEPHLKKNKFVRIAYMADPDINEAVEAAGFANKQDFFRQAARALVKTYRSGKRVEWPLEFVERT
jgi:hypothetical protein